MPVNSDLKAIVRGAYDLQKLRMQSGLRLVANFRAKLKIEVPQDEDDEDEESGPGEEGKGEGDLGKKAKEIIDDLRARYRRFTDGVAKNRTLPAKEKFIGDEVISNFTELSLVSQYEGLVREEDREFLILGKLLGDEPIYQQFLRHQPGIGPAMAGVIITGFDIARAEYPSSLWAYCGIDVAEDGMGRSRREEHLVERPYKDKQGRMRTRMSITYNPWMKTKMVGVLAGCMIRVRGESLWKGVYYDYKHRLETDPNRIKMANVEWKKRYAAGEDLQNVFTPGRINAMAKRYMIKMLLIDLHAVWRELEGYPPTTPYYEGKLGMPRHHQRPLGRPGGIERPIPPS
jgi:hypothetical protein